MSFDYSGLATTAETLIAKFGRDITVRLVTKSGTSYSPTLTNSDTVVKGVAISPKDSEVDGTLIQRGDIQYLIKTSLAIDETSQILDGGSLLSIVVSEQVKPGATLLIYKVLARNASALTEMVDTLEMLDTLEMF